MQSTHQGGTRDARERPSRVRIVSVALAALVLALVPAARTIAGSDLTSEEVADEIVRVQTKADATAVALEEARFAAEDLAEQLAAAQQAVTDARAAVDALEATLADVAIRRYMNAGDNAPVILDADPMTQLE